MNTTLYECLRCGEWAVYTIPQDSAHCDSCVADLELEREKRESESEAPMDASRLERAERDAATLVRKAEANKTGWIRVHATDLRVLRDALRAALDAAQDPAQAMDAEPWAWGAVDPDKPTERAVALTREQAERYAHNLAFSGKAGVGFKYRSEPVVPLYAHPAPPAPDAAKGGAR